MCELGERTELWRLLDQAVIVGDKMIVILILTSTDESGRSALSTNQSPEPGQVWRAGPMRGQCGEV